MCECDANDWLLAVAAAVFCLMVSFCGVCLLEYKARVDAVLTSYEATHEKAGK